MFFNSLHFLLFFPIVVTIYFSLPHKYRWILLLLSSYYFYMSWKAEYVILIMISTLVDYFAGIEIFKSKSQKRKKLFLGISLLACAFLYQRKYHQHQKEEALTALDLKRKTEELEYARQVQISMLPKTNLILEKIQIIGKMVTATEVGGDYYDFIKLEDNRYCIVIGDATGHGVAAGLVVGMLKASLASLLKIFPKQILIKELIENLNIALKESVLQRNMGMSLELAIINIDDLSVELGSAGMPFPYYYNSQTGKLSTLIMQAPPLGFLKHIDVQTRKMQLQAGDILIFLSDGFEERMDIDDEIWGDEALQKILTQICNEEHQAEQITERLIAACDEFADGRENQDDMTIVIILIENS